MAQITLPIGQSLRQVAQHLGVSVDALQHHARVEDVDSPLPTTRAVSVPDGFLRDRSKQAIHYNYGAATQQPGINSTLALNLEYQRTRAAGGLHAHAPSADEEAALMEARRAFMRFEADSNDLAIALYAQAAKSRSSTVRAMAFAGQSLALSQKVRRFGEPGPSVQPHALSAARGAVMAGPKMSQAQIAWSVAIGLGGDAAALNAAFDACERAVQVNPEDPWAWAELGKLCLENDDLQSAEAASHRALELDSHCPAAIELAALVALRQADGRRAWELLQPFVEMIPTHAWAKMLAAAALKHMGHDVAALELRTAGLEQAQNDTQHAFLAAEFARLQQWFGDEGST